MKNIALVAAMGALALAQPAMAQDESATEEATEDTQAEPQQADPDEAGQSAGRVDGRDLQCGAFDCGAGGQTA